MKLIFNTDTAELTFTNGSESLVVGAFTECVSDSGVRTYEHCLSERSKLKIAQRVVSELKGVSFPGMY